MMNIYHIIFIKFDGARIGRGQNFEYPDVYKLFLDVNFENDKSLEKKKIID